MLQQTETNPAPLVPASAFDPSRKGRASRKSAAEKHPDGELIQHCLDFTVNTKGATAAYEVDPTDSHFATFIDDLHGSRARRHLTAATELKAKTIDGLRAKTSLLSIILDDIDGSPLREWHEDFIRSIIADTKRIQQFLLSANTSHHEIKAPVR